MLLLLGADARERERREEEASSSFMRGEAVLSCSVANDASSIASDGEDLKTRALCDALKPGLGDIFNRVSDESCFK